MTSAQLLALADELRAVVQYGVAAFLEVASPAQRDAVLPGRQKWALAEAVLRAAAWLAVPGRYAGPEYDSRGLPTGRAIAVDEHGVQTEGATPLEAVLHAVGVR